MTQTSPRATASTTIGSGGVVYLFVAGLILVAANYTQANLLFWAFGLMVGGLAVSLVLSVLMMRGLSVERLLPAHGVTGDALVLRYRLENHKSWLPAFGLMIHETWGKGRGGWKRSGPIAGSPAEHKPPQLRGRPFGWVLHVGPNQIVQAEAPCWPTRRGTLDFERIVVSTSFPFGVVRRTLSFTQPGKVLIYPRLYRLNRRVLARLSQADPGGRQQRDHGGSEEFYGLREYRPGDSVRQIDWKHSAKTGELVAREMTLPSPPRIMLALEIAPHAQAKDTATQGRAGAGHTVLDDTLDPVERAVSLAASIVCDAHLHGYQLGLALVGARSPSGAGYTIHHSLPHRTRMLEALARLTIGANPGAAPLPARPSVLVTTADHHGSVSEQRLMVLRASDLERYIIASRSAPAELLSSRPIAPTRQRRLQNLQLTTEAPA